MGMIKCSVCETNDSITYCSETSVPLCGTCAIPCDVCNIPISSQRAQLTSRGRKLCTKCMNDRNSRRKAKRAQLKTESREKKRAQRATQDPFQPTEPAASIATPPTAAPIPPKSPGVGSPGIVASPHFHSMLDDAPAPVASTSLEALGGPRSPASAPLDAAQKNGEFGDDFGAMPDDFNSDEAKHDYGMEGAPTETSGRLELPPIDVDHPIYVQSGYQPPTKTKYFFAFMFFGISGIIFYGTTPILHDLMFPFDTPDYEFVTGQLTPIQDTNALRNTSNISQFEILSQGPIFFITWSILIVYVGGSAWLILSTVRSLISSLISNRRLKKAQKNNPGDSYNGLERL